MSDLFSTSLVSVTIRTRSKMPWAVLVLAGQDTFIQGYASSESEALRMASSGAWGLSSHHYVVAPIVNGKVEVLV